MQAPEKPEPIRQTWRTPRWLFEAMNGRCRFTLDAYADEDNALCERFNSREEPLRNLWAGERVFANPPFSRCAEAVDKALSDEPEAAALVLPANISTRWFQRLTEEAEIVSFDRRIAYDPPPGIKPSSPAQASIVALIGFEATDVFPEAYHYLMAHCPIVDLRRAQMHELGARGF